MLVFQGVNSISNGLSPCDGPHWVCSDGVLNNVETTLDGQKLEPQKKPSYFP